jgi:hypothetical protein
VADAAGAYADTNLVTCGLGQIALVHAKTAANFRNDHGAHLGHRGLHFDWTNYVGAGGLEAYSDGRGGGGARFEKATSRTQANCRVIRAGQAPARRLGLSLLGWVRTEVAKNIGR